LVVTATNEPSGWLIDKSALVRLGRSRETEVWADRIERGLVRIATAGRGRGPAPGEASGENLASRKPSDRGAGSAR